MNDYVIISDLHLGSDVCRADDVLEFLHYLETSTLILNGDIFDNLNFERLKSSHWQIVKKLRKLTKQTSLVWVRGNHDKDAEAIAHLIGAVFVNEYIIDEYDDRSILVTHGDQFDSYINKRPLLSRFADYIYRKIQKFDKWRGNNYHYSEYIKNKSKTFLKSMYNTEQSALRYAKKNGFDGLVMGHLHRAIHITDDIEYANSGSWTQKECSYVTVNQGQIKLEKFISGVEISTSSRNT